ncbi:MAG: WD40/YVTN/BNR-like repeat-containing protein [Candidatus Methylacidiphilales bacterium]|nr:hypothetical protein [Candidatus Methylacidiphilales bacterium]
MMKISSVAICLAVLPLLSLRAEQPAAGSGNKVLARSGDLSADYDWKPMTIGGGGWVVGMHFSPTEKGLMYVRADVSGAYRWDPATSRWKQLVTEASMPAGDVGYARYAGVDSIVSAPKDPNVAYMAFCGRPHELGPGQIYKSTNKGDNWTPTSFGTHKVKMLPNGKGRQEGERLAVDPVNTDVVYFGSIQDGLWLTEDGGANWAKVDTIPAGAALHGVNTIHYDKASGVVTSQDKKVSRTKDIFVTVDQCGVFKSTDAGRTWTNISEKGPGNNGKIRDSELGPDRTFYVACAMEKDKDGSSSTGSVWKYSPAGEWTDITPQGDKGGSKGYVDLAVNPVDPHYIVAMINGGRTWVSRDQGVSWTYYLFEMKSDKISWHGKQQNFHMSVGEIEFDPFEPETLWFAEGFGVWKTKDLTARNITWESESVGIEEMCGNDVVAPPGGRPMGAMWDLGAFYFENLDNYTAVKSHPYFMSTWALDWCASDPRFIVGVFQSHLGFPPNPKSSGFSTDGGKTWTRFAALENNTLPADLEYGVIAVTANSPDKIVWCPARNKMPYFTTDRGATWKQSKLEGLKTDTGFVSYPMALKPLCADRVKPDTFYFYSPRAGEGVSRSTDGGATFQKMGATVDNSYSAILKTTPGKEGDLWFAEGSRAGLWNSKDGGATWTKKEAVTIAFNVGLGKSKTEGGYPTLYIAGVVDGQHGIYRSTDEGTTWEKLSNYPLGIFDYVDAIDGDKDVFGKVYVCFSGSGFAYGTPKVAQENAAR